MADHLAVLNMPLDALKHSHTVTSFEPFTLLSALAMVTEHIGLVATGSTTFDAPYHVARRFASLDHLSGGRAGWNIVTTSNPDAALNFGMTDHMEHGERYRRAREFYDVVTGLWDSWADDAFIRDVEARPLFRSRQAARARSQGQISVGARAAQHRASDPGLAGRSCRPARPMPAASSRRRPRKRCSPPPSNIAAGREFYADVKGRMEKAGRARDHMKIMPACFVVVGDTRRGSAREAREARQPRAITTTPSPRCRSRSATTPRASIRMSRCPISPRATPARARASA